VSRSLTFGTQVTRSGISTGTVGPLQIRTIITAMVHNAGPKGTIRIPYTYGNFQLLNTSVGDPQQLAAVRTSLAQYRGLSGEYAVSSTGQVLSNRFKIPSGVNSTLRSLLQQLSSQSDQLSVPLPTQAVGIGARWRGTTQLSAGGITARQTYEYTLRSREGGRLALDVTYTQTAPHQRVSAPGLSKGETVDVTNYLVTGTGTTGLDLSQVAPLNGHLVAQGVQEFQVKQGSQSGKLTQHVQLSVDLAPA
jgi:hypothetical protein